MGKGQVSSDWFEITYCKATVHSLRARQVSDMAGVMHMCFMVIYIGSQLPKQKMRHFGNEMSSVGKNKDMNMTTLRRC